MTRTLFAVMATTALTVPALAQDEMQAENQACIDLATYVQDGDPTEYGLSPDQAMMIAERDDAQACQDAMRVARGEISMDKADANFDVDATARLRVIVPEPDVTVRQAAPEVEVEQAQPTVRVDPGRPVVTVRQANPVVNVEVPQPRITIDMPKPSITIEMPDASVDVEMAQPRVTVNQPQPEVQVEQGEVTLRMGDSEATPNQEGDQADVQIEQQNAEVQVKKPDPADVVIADVQPDIRYEAAQPQINVEQSGEAEIQFNQSGEAEVQFRQMTAEETRAAAEEQQARLETDREQSAGNRIVVGDLVDKNVIGADGEELGSVEAVVAYENRTYLVVASADSLGTDGRMVGLPASDVSMKGDDQLTMKSLTAEDVKDASEIDPDNFERVSQSEEVEIAG